MNLENMSLKEEEKKWRMHCAHLQFVKTSENDRQLLLEYLNTELERLRICAEILSHESGEALLAGGSEVIFSDLFPGYIHG